MQTLALWQGSPEWSFQKESRFKRMVFVLDGGGCGVRMLLRCVESDRPRETPKVKSPSRSNNNFILTREHFNSSFAFAAIDALVRVFLYQIGKAPAYRRWLWNPLAVAADIRDVAPGLVSSFRRPFIARPVIIDNLAFGWLCGIAISLVFHVTAIIIALFLQ